MQREGRGLEVGQRPACSARQVELKHPVPVVGVHWRVPEVGRHRPDQGGVLHGPGPDGWVVQGIGGEGQEGER